MVEAEAAKAEPSVGAARAEGAGSEQAASRRLRTACQFLLVLAMAVWIASNVHVTSHISGRAPYIATDDVLGNVSLTLADLHRWGFMASPLPGGLVRALPDAPMQFRHRNFLNYGPYYFYLGAAASWLFGDSIEVLRGLHLFGLLLVCAMALAWMARDSLAAPALLLALTLISYGSIQWPMVRPDIMVSVFAFGAIVCVGWGMMGRGLAWWLSAGFCATSAFVSHQIAFGIAPAMGLVWVIWAAGEKDRSRSRTWQALLAGLAGALLSLLIYLCAIKFEVRELTTIWSAYFGWMRGHSTVPGPQSLGYGAVFLKHLHMAWDGAPAILVVAAGAGIALALLALVASTWLAVAERTRVRALLVPPLVVGMIQQAAMGIYNNYHTGYEIFSQIWPLWLLAAALAALVGVVRGRRPVIGGLVESVLALSVAALLISQTAVRLHNGTNFTPWAAKSVPIAEYVNHVLDPLPRGATAWGEITLGMEAGTRLEFVSYGDAMDLLSQARKSRRAALAPQFLLLGVGAQAGDLGDLTRGRYTGVLEFVAKSFPESEYRLVRLVYAPPYGTTAVYERVEAGSAHAPGPPEVLCWDADGGQWTSRTGAPLAVAPGDVPPVQLSLEGVGQVTPVRSLAVDLPQGYYLVTLDIDPAGAPGLVIATSPGFTGRPPQPGDFSSALASAPYVPYTKETSLLVQHESGTLTISQFGAPASGMTVKAVRPLQIVSPARPASPVALPELGSWNVVGGARRIGVKEGVLEVEGTASPSLYQVMSAPIVVPPHTEMELSLPVTVEGGSVALGVLDEKAGWLAQAPKKSVLRFNTGDNRQITIVVYNDFATPPPGKPVIRLQPPHLRAFEMRGHYVDALVDESQAHDDPGTR